MNVIFQPLNFLRLILLYPDFYDLNKFLSESFHLLEHILRELDQPSIRFNNSYDRFLSNWLKWLADFFFPDFVEFSNYFSYVSIKSVLNRVLRSSYLKIILGWEAFWNNFPSGPFFLILVKKFFILELGPICIVRSISKNEVIVVFLPALFRSSLNFR